MGFVIPAQAGIQGVRLRDCGTRKHWIPASAGMTESFVNLD
jgi:hypothetical protein